MKFLKWDTEASERYKCVISQNIATYVTITKKLYHARSISIMGSTILRAHCTILLLIHVGNLSRLIQGFLVTVIIHAVSGLRVDVWLLKMS